MMCQLGLRVSSNVQRVHYLHRGVPNVSHTNRDRTGLTETLAEP